MSNHWAEDSVFYHIYPLGFCDAPQRNDQLASIQPRLEKIHMWIPHLLELGVNALYLGPLFESSAHGYDTADYYHLDRRLGSDDTLVQLIRALHANGIRVILDGVFNHTGREFWAFRDVLQNGASSAYCNWFKGLRFDERSPFGDPFTYDAWNGHFELVNLNLQNPQVREHLLGAVQHWIQDFEIDGLRLDVADSLDLDFQRELSGFTRSLRSDFLLLGEVIHGDYRRWINPETLHSVTNYESYKGLYSSLVDKNYFEIAYALNRQFGEQGIYRNLPLYNFVDNHDVDRVASKLINPAHLFPLYCLLFTMPGIPSVYYGSEWGLQGLRSETSDKALRPGLDLESLQQASPHPELPGVLKKLARMRHEIAALRSGSYCQLWVSSEQLAFSRQQSDQVVIVQINSSGENAKFDIQIPFENHTRLVDVLNDEESFVINNGHLVNSVSPSWARVLVTES